MKKENAPTKDKYKAIWVSHSSMGDFLRCPRAYYLRNVYKDKRTGRKITVMKPPLALGQVIHDVVESLSTIKAEDRLAVSLIDKFEQQWKKIKGKKGGFKTKKEEQEYKQRGIKMLKKIMDKPGPILKQAVKIKQDLPYYWISEDDDIILCGKIDWLEYLPEDDAVGIIDFKTGKKEEDPKSLQLPIYHLLATNTQSRKVKRASYWYLEHDDQPAQIDLPDLDKAHDKVLEVARRVALARRINRFICPTDGCFYCRDLERVLKSEGELVGTHPYGQDIYILK